MRVYMACSHIIGVFVFVQVAACVDGPTPSQRNANSTETEGATTAARAAYDQVASIAQAARYGDATSILGMSDHAKARARLQMDFVGHYALYSVDAAAAFSAADATFSRRADAEVDTWFDPTRTNRAALAARTAAAVARSLDRLADADANMYAAAAAADANTYDTVASRQRRAELRVRMEEFYVAFDDVAEEAAEFFASAANAE